MGSKVKSVAVVFFLFFSVLFAFVPTVSAAAPVQSNENPASGSTDQELGFNWNVTVKDPDGDLMNVTITCIAAPSGSSFWPDHVNDSFIVPLSGMSYSTKYFVDVNATDGSSWTNATYNFTTKANPFASTTNYMTSFVIPVLVAVGVLILVVGMLFTTGVSRETLITSMIIIVLAAVFLKVIMGV